MTEDEKLLTRLYPMVGLSADWCCSAWQTHPNVVIFDNEDDDESYSVVVHRWDEQKGETISQTAFTGSAIECIEQCKLNDDTISRLVEQAIAGTLESDDTLIG